MRKPQLCGLRHAEEGKHTQGNADLEINVGICNILDKEVNIFFLNSIWHRVKMESQRNTIGTVKAECGLDL